MLQTSLLLMKSFSKTEIPIFLSVVRSLFPNLFGVYLENRKGYRLPEVFKDKGNATKSNRITVYFETF